MTNAPLGKAIERLIAVVGKENAITGAAEMDPYLHEWREPC